MYNNGDKMERLGGIWTHNLTIQQSELKYDTITHHRFKLEPISNSSIPRAQDPEAKDGD